MGFKNRFILFFFCKENAFFSVFFTGVAKEKESSTVRKVLVEVKISPLNIGFNMWIIVFIYACIFLKSRRRFV